MKKILCIIICSAALQSFQVFGERKKYETALLGKRAQFQCNVQSSDASEVTLWWQFQGRNLTSTEEDHHRITVSKSASGAVTSELILDQVEWTDEGIYTCLAKQVASADEPTKQDIELDIYAAPKHIKVTNGSGKTGTTTELSCTYEGRPLPTIRWLGFGKDLTEDPVKYEITTSQLNDKQITSFLKIMSLTHTDNGTYLCHGENDYGIDVAILENLVLDKPSVQFDMVVPVAKDKIFFNWTVSDWNSPVTDYFLSYRKGGATAWVYFIDQKIPKDATSFIMRNLTADATYRLKLAAQNEFGMGEFDLYHSDVQTLKSDPTYVPEVGVKGITWNSVSLGWNPPPTEEVPNILDYITYYKITRETKNEESVVYQPVEQRPTYLWTNLDPATEYSFHVYACNGYTLECGRPSKTVKGTTEDGKSGPPSHVVAKCKFDNISDMNFVEVEWAIPQKPNGLIEFYNIELNGLATYVEPSGSSSIDRFGPEMKTEDPTSISRSSGKMTTRFDFLPANTNFSVSICAVTRRQECGEAALSNCKMRAMPPKMDLLSRSFQWINDRRLDRDIFRLRTLKLSQRNGPICCIRVVMVKMKHGSGAQDLPANPEELPMLSYNKVHDEKNANAWGAYIAEILGPNSLGRDIFVGDGQNTLAQVNDQCPACQSGVRAHLLRSAQYRESQSLRAKRTVGALNLRVEDGFLDPESNYTAFVEIVVPEGPGKNIIGRSPYMIPRKPGEYVYPDGTAGGSSSDVSTALVSILAVLASLVTVALCLLLALILLRRYSKALGPGSPGGSDQVDGGELGQDLDMRKSFTHFCNTIFRGKRDSQYLIPSNGDMGNVAKSGSSSAIRKPVDTKPIGKDDLVAAYCERHRDSDYGFQAEFEQLPTSFPDRTTEICDRPANRPKNRYPDIKCYDQTRVRLKLPDEDKDVVDGDDKSESSNSSASMTAAKQEKIPTSQNDYINANYVMGYKDRKKWICAQGPLEHTVQDFWRMVYEQNVEMIIMLTNLEEYNRIKCAQYWPQAGDSTFTPWPNLLLNIRFCTEKRFSDYIVRELTLTATKASITKAANGSDLDVKTTETRTVKHYHYLQWKDFNAPEHAPAMLRFVKRINEDHTKSRTLNPPILVHCSAGVGRSGTLVAIDGLIQQLREEHQVSIYNTVCDLRHQRNFLVQSVKQFMFVYRAIMEMAQFGDTELDASTIKSTWQSLTENAGKKLELEFARLANMVDDRKALSVGTSEQNRDKNQSDTVIPFDRNRVILTPDGQRPDSTYINASFIEGYHNDESFIITQDPMSSTVEDFWRMVTEHNICTMVQLNAPTPSAASLNKGGYWAEEDKAGSQITYGSIQVTLKAKEDMPSYVKREFVVYNMKVEEEVTLSHFAYSGWGDAPQRPRSPNPGQGSPEMPSTTTGLLDLVEHALAHKIEASLPGPIAVHCRFGSERSSVFVALSCLVQQLKTEGRADVFTTVRKLRSQRQGMVQHVSQYKFIYRAISDYVDLYRNKDDEYAYSVPVNAVNSNATSSKSSKSGTLSK